MDTLRLEGELRGFSYEDEQGAFAVGRFKLNSGEEVTVVGPLATLRPGQQARLSGRWESHKVHGRQFRVRSFLADDPRTLEGLRAYLSHGTVRGIGPELAGRLVKRFGLDTLRVLSEDPEALVQVPGIGPAKVRAIRASWVADREDRELLASLRGYGLSPALTRRVMERYDADALAVVTREPYRLAQEVTGIGFRRADAIARQNGIARDDPMRVEAAVFHVLARAEDEGHCFLPLRELAAGTQKLDVPEEARRACVQRLADERRLLAWPTVDPTIQPLQLPQLARLERQVASRIMGMLSRSTQPSLLTVRDAERASGLTLNEDQRLAVERGLHQGVVVLTGGPGTGKTTIVRVLLAAVGQLGETWKLAAPTGRAARRLAEACGQEASTLHRLLEFAYPQMSFRKNASNPLQANGVIVDEASMMDLRLTAALLDAMPPRGRLVIVGDAHQLPAVGAGQVLGDLIASGAVPVVRLREIYRQAAGSAIVRNAHRVDRGAMPISAEKDPQLAASGSEHAARQRPAERDFFFVEREDPLEIQATLVEAVTRRLPRLGFEPMNDVQVLVPVHRGPLGTVNMNRVLQDTLNPGAGGLQSRQWCFRPGDRVIQMRNNYQTEVFNGEVGRVLRVEESALEVDFDGRVIALTGDRIREVEPAYAITVHKSQGSEYPAVVLALHRSHHIMLRRNLIYTAITRASRFCCIIGSRRALRLAVGLSGRRDRHTMLADLLREELG